MRAATGYWRASRVGESRIFSPTQSLSRLIARSRGSSAGPPSQPQAATSDAGRHEAEPEEVSAGQTGRLVTHGWETGRDTIR